MLLWTIASRSAYRTRSRKKESTFFLAFLLELREVHDILALHLQCGEGGQ